MPQDLIEQLIWPRLLKAPALALAPTRLGLGFFCLLLLALLWQLPQLWIDGPGPFELAANQITGALAELSRALASWSVDALLNALGGLFYRAPAAMLTTYPITTLVLLIPSLAVWCVGVGAISRSTACEFSLDVLTPWPAALGFSLSRCGSLMAALAAPLVVVLVLALLIAAAGAALLTWPVGDVIGAILYPAALLLATIAVIAITGYMLGHKLLVPAVVCEGTDAVDAIQRSYAYVIGRPLRLLIYLSILALVGALCLFIAAAIAAGINAFAAGAAGYWSGPRGREILSGAPIPAGGTRAIASSIIRIFAAIPTLLAAAYAVSLYAGGSTVLYLLLRQVNDGQDPAELWMPGSVPGAATPVPAGERSDDAE